MAITRLHSLHLAADKSWPGPRRVGSPRTSRQITAKLIAVMLLTGCFQAPAEQDGVAPSPVPEQKSLNAGSAVLPKGKKSNCLAITNGQASADFPSVVLLLNQGSPWCTGVFVSSSTLLTAKHCMQNTNAQNLSVMQNGVPVNALNALFLGGFTDAEMSGPGAVPNDVAVVIFPEGTAPAIAGFAPRPPHAGDPHTIVGFGETIENSGNNQNAAKFIGHNQILSVYKHTIGYTGSPGSGTNTSGSNSVSGHGDSGGPMFVGGGLVGLCSAGNPISDLQGWELSFFDLADPALAGKIRGQVQAGQSLAVDFYTNVYDAGIRGILRQATAAGANIPGLDALDAAALAPPANTLASPQPPLVPPSSGPSAVPLRPAPGGSSTAGESNCG